MTHGQDARATVGGLFQWAAGGGGRPPPPKGGKIAWKNSCEKRIKILRPKNDDDTVSGLSPSGRRTSQGAGRRLPAARAGRADPDAWLFDNRIGVVKKRKVHRRSAKAARPVVADPCGSTTNVAKLLRVHGGCLGVMRR